MDKADLFREAIKTFVRVQAAERLVALGVLRPAWLTFLAVERKTRHERNSGRHIALETSFPAW